MENGHQPTSQNNISIENHEDIIISRKKRYRSHNMPNYSRIGQLDTGDLVDILAKLSKGAITLFVHLKHKRDDINNLVTLPATQSSSENTLQNKSLRELQKYDLIRRVGVKQLKGHAEYILNVPKRTFMINPLYLFPRSNDDFDLAYNYWDQLEN